MSYGNRELSYENHSSKQPLSIPIPKLAMILLKTPFEDIMYYSFFFLVDKPIFFVDLSS